MSQIPDTESLFCRLGIAEPATPVASRSPSAQDDMMAFLNPVSCAGTKGGNASDKLPCRNVAKLVCSSCKLIQYCAKECQATDWPRHKKTCKSYLMKSKYVPGWVKEGRKPSWVSDSELSSKFGTSQYLWGNIPAVNLLSVTKMDTICDSHRDTDVLFAASGDLRNVVKSVVEGLPNEYHGRCYVQATIFMICGGILIDH